MLVTCRYQKWVYFWKYVENSRCESQISTGLSKLDCQAGCWNTLLRRGHADVQASSGGSGHCDTPRPVILDAAFTDDRSSAAPHWLRDDRSSHAELWAVGGALDTLCSAALGLIKLLISSLIFIRMTWQLQDIWMKYRRILY